MNEGSIPIYLHYFDRELCEAAGTTIEPQIAERALKLVSLAGVRSMYCGLALLWESPAVNRNVCDLLNELYGAGRLTTISSYTSISTFIESRQNMYSHDTERYPVYFGNEDICFSSFNFVKKSETTPALAEKIKGWRPTMGVAVRASHLMRQNIIARAGRAITFALFRETVNGEQRPLLIKDLIRRQISTSYTEYYTDMFGGNIMTGIPGLSYYDSVSSSFPVIDYIMLYKWYSLIGCGRLINSGWAENDAFWTEIIQSPDTMSDQLSHMSAAINGLDIKYRAMRSGSLGDGYESFISRRTYIEGILGRYSSMGFSDDLGMSAASVADRSSTLAEAITGDELSESEAVPNDGNYDVILLSVNEIEFEEISSQMKSLTGGEGKRRYVSDFTVYDYGIVSGLRIGVVQTGMGSVGVLASAVSVSRVIDKLNPTYIIAVGVGFGIDSEKQKIGQVLISERLHLYEPARVGTSQGGEIVHVSRGDTVTASPKLLDRLRSTSRELEDVDARFGLLLTGEKLIDNKNLREMVKARQPEAIGGEMEGAGIYSAAQRNAVQWVVVKGICDWADGHKGKNKSARQHKAAAASSRLVAAMLDRGGLGAS